MKALLGIMHPRRLPHFLDSLLKIDYIDVVLAKNYPQIDAENQIKKFFLENNYDILVLTSDDVEIPYDGPKTIVEDMVNTGYQIVSGWSLCRPNRYEANINLNPIYGIERLRGKPVWYHQYHFLKVSEVENMLSEGKTIIPVWFVGYSLTGMTREIVAKWIPKGWHFQSTPPYHYVHNGRKGFWSSTDLWFSYQTWRLGYNKFCDLRVYVPHNPPMLNKSSGLKASVLLVGKEPPEITFIKAKKEGV